MTCTHEPVWPVRGGDGTIHFWECSCGQMRNGGAADYFTLLAQAKDNDLALQGVQIIDNCMKHMDLSPKRAALLRRLQAVLESA